MKTVKKLLTWLLVAAMVFSLCACGEGEKGPEDPKPSPSATAPTEKPTEGPTEGPTEEPTEEPTAEPTEEPTVEPTEEPTEEPTVEPTVEPTEEPTEPSDPSAGTSVAGTYWLYCMDVDGMESAYETIVLLGLDTSYLRLNDDGTAQMYMTGEEVQDLTWDPEAMTISDGEYPIPFTVEGEMLTIAEDDQYIVYVLEGSDLLQGGEGPDLSDPTGIYTCISGQYADGTDFSDEDLASFWITLYDDGSALFGTPDATSDLEWKLDEGLFLAYSFASEDLVFSGTWENGLLELTHVYDIQLLLQKSEDFSSEPDPEFYPDVDTYIANCTGDWIGKAKLYGEGIYAELNGVECEIVVRLVFDENAICSPFIAMKMDNSDDNFRYIGVIYSVDHEYQLEHLELLGEFYGMPIVDGSISVYDDAMYLGADINDDEGNYLNVFAMLRQPGDQWDYEYDDPCLTPDELAAYDGMTFEEIVASFGCDPDELPQIGEDRPETDGLEELRQSMVGTSESVGYAYLGTLEQPLEDGPMGWIGSACPEMMQDLPFIGQIPEDRILGGDHGELFVIVPRDEDATVMVDLVSSELYEVMETVYRQENSDPILIFCDPADQASFYQVVVTSNDGSSVTIYPGLDDAGVLFPPTDEEGGYMALDFTPYSELYASGLKDWISAGWSSPTEEQLCTGGWTYYTMESGATYFLDLSGSGDAAFYWIDYDQTEPTKMYSGLWYLWERDGSQYLDLDLMCDGGPEVEEEIFSNTYPVLVDEDGRYLLLGKGVGGTPMPFPVDEEITAVFDLAVG